MRLVSDLSLEVSRGVQSSRLARAKEALRKAEVAQGVRGTGEKAVTVDALSPGVYHLVDAGPAPLELMMSALAQVSGQGKWVAVAGFPDVGWEAAGQMGLDMNRVITIPKIDSQIEKTLGVLVEGFDVVAVGHFLLPFPVKRALGGRVRTMGGLLLTALPWTGISRPFPALELASAFRLGRGRAG